MNNSLIKVIKWVVIFCQVSIVGATFFGAAVLLTQQDDLDLSISNLALLPTDDNLLNYSNDLGITLKANPNLDAQLLIKKTTIRIEDASLFTEPVLVILLCVGIFSMIILEQMRRMIKTVEEGNPFTKSNVWRITILGTMFLLVPVVARVLYIFYEKWIMNKFEFEGLTLASPSFTNLPWILAGFLFLTIGKILAAGIQLREDQDLTI